MIHTQLKKQQLLKLSQAKIIKVQEMCSDLNAARMEQGNIARSAIFIYNQIVNHHFVEITLKGSDNYTYTWLL